MTAPISKANIFNTALPAAEAPLLGVGADIIPMFDPGYLDIYVTMSIAGIFRVARTVAAATVVENLNSGIALVAGAKYAFSIEWRAGESINFRYSTTAGTINKLQVDEFGG